MPEWRESFDAILLVSVIEHIQHLNPLIERIRGMLSTDGVLLIEHPDVLRFSPDVSGPFQEFSTEHINFFSNLSLANLLRRHGFRELLTFQEDRPSADGVMEPSSLSVFGKTDAISPEPVIPDLQTKLSLQAYIAESQRIDEHICTTIDRIVDGGLPVIIWGVGAHTQRLMATSRLKSANIRAFTDSNPRYQGKQLLGFPIISPEELRAFPDPILISSKIWQQDIARQIRAKGNENEIILLYPERSVREHSAI
jgi:hypothetical protein